MRITSDLRTARKLLSTTLRARAARSEVAKRRRRVPQVDAGSIEVAVYFADGPVNLYQIRQWYAPLAELAATRRVAIVSRSPETVLALWDEAPVPVVYARTVVDLEQFVRDQPLKLVLYVNQNTRNFQMFRYGRMWHVFVNHGESDKMYMTTNQFKAYDYSFVAGDAALDRLRRKLWDFDLDRRAIPIGRPQADHFAGELPYVPDDRTVVLYAPTWEGDRAAAAYGSIASHGVALVRPLVATGRHRVIYRPHPRSGVTAEQYRAANERIARMLAEANAADPAAHHVHDTGAELGWQLAAADVAICDISAMVYDRLATGKPLLVTRPLSPHADVDERGYLGAAEWLLADGAGDVVDRVDELLTADDAQERVRHWSQRHFGDTTPGAATARFHAAVEQLVGEWHRHAAQHEGESDGSESDPFDAEDETARTTL